jgi:malate/lactate dehydrogenase
VILGAQGLVKVIEILLTSDESTQFIDAAEKIEELSRKL